MPISRECVTENVTLTTSKTTTASIDVAGFSSVRLHFATGVAPGILTVYDMNPSDAVYSDSGETISAPPTAPSSVKVPDNVFAATTLAITTTNDISSATVGVVKKR